MVDLGAGEILLTSMDWDGTKNGFDLEVICVISNVVYVLVIVFGGVGNLQYLVDGVMLGKVDVVLVVSIFYFVEYSICEVKEFMVAQGIEMCLE